MKTEAIQEERIACCSRCPPFSHSILTSAEDRQDVVFCKIHGEIPLSEVNETIGLHITKSSAAPGSMGVG